MSQQDQRDIVIQSVVKRARSMAIHNNWRLIVVEGDSGREEPLDKDIFIMKDHYQYTEEFVAFDCTVLATVYHDGEVCYE